MISDMERLLVTVATALEHVPARYAVGGSVASTRHGEPRMTSGLDVLVASRFPPEAGRQGLPQSSCPRSSLVLSLAWRPSLEQRDTNTYLNPESGP